MGSASAQFFFWFLVVVVLQRLVELAIAAQNGRKIRRQGGYEVAAGHYKYLVLLHVLFFVSLVLEVTWRQFTLPPGWMVPLLFFLFAQGIRIWVIQSLGLFWNTRIYILPGAGKVRRGPYRFLRHPNYVVVLTEFLMLPLIFGAWMTAFVFTFINAVFLLKVRIPAEEAAWHEASQKL